MNHIVLLSYTIFFQIYSIRPPKVVYNDTEHGRMKIDSLSNKETVYFLHILWLSFLLKIQTRHLLDLIAGLHPPSQKASS